MKKARLLCLCLVSLVLSISLAHAQSRNAAIPRFTPSVPWTVAPTEMASVRGLEGLALPCVMKAGFNNGYVVRFSGGGGRIMAMAIDFRQSVFKKEQTYKTHITIDKTVSRAVNAKAFSESVLLFDLASLGNLYTHLSKTNALGLEIEGNRMRFDLGNMKASLAQLDQCYTGSTGHERAVLKNSSMPYAMKKMGVQSSQPELNVYSDSDLSRPRISRPVMDDVDTQRDMSPRVAAAELAKSMREPRMGGASTASAPVMTSRSIPQYVPQRVESLTVPPRTMEMSTPLPRPTTLGRPMVSQSVDGNMDTRVARTPRMPTPSVNMSSSGTSIASMTADTPPRNLRPNNVWRADAGDDMKIVLAQWAERAGVDLQWDATNNGRVASDVNVVGSFEEAVQTLMAQNAAVLGLEADMRGAQRISATPVSHGTSSWQGSMGASKWVAASGASLRETLQSWSLKEGVAFLWKAGKEYKVKSPIQNNGDYTEALQELLNQYANDTIRPAAELNVDPSTGDKLLSVE